MKVAVGSLGSSLDAWVGGRFGYCPQFIIVDTDTMDHVVVPMPAAMSEREASQRAIRIVAQNGADALIVEKAMPACCEVMTALGIEIIEGVRGLSVRQAVQRFQSGQLSSPEERQGESHRIAVAALGSGLEAAVGTRFGQVHQFVIVDPATMSTDILPVQPVNAGKHLRLATIRSLVERGVNLVATPSIAPECCQALWSLAVDVVLVEPKGTVGDIIAAYKEGTLGEAQVLWPEEEAE